MILIYDLALNDENIFQDKQDYVRKFYGQNPDFINKLFEFLANASKDVVDIKYWDMREYILQVLFRIFQICTHLVDDYKQILIDHR